jgi:hypothetical protein
MNCEASLISMTTTKKLGAALLLGCALGASDLAAAAGQPEAPAGREQGASPTRLAQAATQQPTAPADSTQVKALQKQLKEVQAQLRELAEQNKALLEHQKAIDRQLQQQQEQLAQQAALQAQLNAQVQPATNAPGAVALGGGQLSAPGMVAQTGGQAGARGQGTQRGVASGAGQTETTQGGAAPGAGQAQTAQGGVTSGAGQTQTAQSALPGQTPSSAVPGSSSALPDSTSALPNATPSAGATLASFAQGVKLWGYGEIYYTDPLHDRDRAQADLARAVFGIGYTFDSRTEFNSEYEVEHAVSSASDPGEFEVEQFYVDHQIIDPVAVRAGLFLMPFGFINEHHEPTNFYGVQRNFVETLIIPSTWREGGFNFHGSTQSGFGWNVGLTTGFDLSKWDFAPEFPQYTTALELINGDAGPLHATHQELALANAHDLSQYVALSYFGVPGLTLGGAAFTGKAAGVPAPPNAPIAGSQRVTLWEGHVRWTPGKFDLSALYARGSISNLAAINAANPGSPNPIPSSFYGYFFQAAYDLWQHGSYRLAPFTRWEVYNLGASYAGTPGPMIPEGDIPLTEAPGDYGPWPRNNDRVWTIGANFYITPHVVLKTDYQHFLINDRFTRFDLGLGVAF